MRRFIALGDIHGPHGIDITPILRFIRSFKPNVAILAGDICEFNAISYWNQKEAKRNIEKTIKETHEEVMLVNRLMDNIDKALSPSCKKIFMMGNHEDRLDRFQQEEAQLLKQDVSSLLALDKRGYRVVPSSGWFKLGKLYFLHGQAYKGESYCKIAAMKCHRNLRLWHSHTNQEFSVTSPLDSKQKISVKGIGCLCNLAPEFLQGAVNRWCHSFLMGYIQDNGNFQDYVVNIIDGELIAPDGKVYRS